VTLHIVIPVKHLSDSKTRLAPALAEDERQALALRLVRSVLAVAQQAQQQLGAVAIVVSPDPAVLDLATTYGLLPLREHSLPAPITDHRVTDYRSCPQRRPGASHRARPQVQRLGRAHPTGRPAAADPG
jgi:hypothetical protein